jgi:hypothetical protein
VPNLEFVLSWGKSPVFAVYSWRNSCPWNAWEPTP